MLGDSQQICHKEVLKYHSLMFFGVEKEVKKLTDAASNVTIVEPPPNKKCKTVATTLDITQDDSCAASSVESNVWMKVDGYMLTLSDEKDLVNNEMLNDRHINVAQRLLNIQFPDIEGLGHTLLQNRPPTKSISNGLQIIFVRGNHWIVASSITCDTDTIQAYDSLYSTVDEDSKKVIFNLFEKSRTKIIQVSVQNQQGGRDCGLFAVAISTALLFGIDVTTIQFHECETRCHMHKCFNAKLLSPFPSTKL